MSLEVRIDGTAALKRLAVQIRTGGRKDLARELDKALSKTVVPVESGKTADDWYTWACGLEDSNVEQAAEAYDRMMSGKARFRVVITMNPQ